MLTGLDLARLPAHLGGGALEVPVAAVDLDVEQLGDLAGGQAPVEPKLRDRPLPRAERADDRAVVLGVELAEHLIVNRRCREPCQLAGLGIAGVGVLDARRSQSVRSVLSHRSKQVAAQVVRPEALLLRPREQRGCYLLPDVVVLALQSGKRPPKQAQRHRPVLLDLLPTRVGRAGGGCRQLTSSPGSRRPSSVSSPSRSEPLPAGSTSHASLRDGLVLFAHSCPEGSSCTSARFSTPSHGRVEKIRRTAAARRRASSPCPTARHAIANRDACELHSAATSTTPGGRRCPDPRCGTLHGDAPIALDREADPRRGP
jgi:hypothetical protein